MPHWWPWRPRETVLVTLGIIVMVTLLNTVEKTPSGLRWANTENYPQIDEVTQDASRGRATVDAADNQETDKYTQQIATYLEGRRKGLTQQQIAKDIFKVSHDFQVG